MKFQIDVMDDLYICMCTEEFHFLMDRKELQLMSLRPRSLPPHADPKYFWLFIHVSVESYGIFPYTESGF